MLRLLLQQYLILHYDLLVKKLDSLKIKDHQLDDGYDWGGGRIGFDVYLKNNIDSILVYFGYEAQTLQEVKNQATPVSNENKTEIKMAPKIIESEIGAVTDLVVRKASEKTKKKRESKAKKNNYGKSSTAS